MDGAGEALEQWRWLVPETAEPVLLTTLGDLFLRTPDGAIYFLSTANGTFDRVAPSYAPWKQELRSQRRVSEWFCPAFVAELHAVGRTVGPGEVYSPTIPEVLGGAVTPANYSATPWIAHFHFLGQVHRQVKDLPVGTPTTRISFE
jgi:hypothetical protein